MYERFPAAWAGVYAEFLLTAEMEGLDHLLKECLVIFMHVYPLHSVTLEGLAATELSASDIGPVVGGHRVILTLQLLHESLEILGL